VLLEIVDDDVISRCIIYPKFFNGNIHTDELLWHFGNNKDDNGVYHESAVLRRLAPTEKDVHHIGCNIASLQNERVGNPDPGDNKRRYYCGFRSATFGDFDLTGDGYIIQFIHCPEHDVESHVDVSLTITVEGKNAKASRRTEAGLNLAEVFGSASEHICSVDSKDVHHPITKLGSDCLVFTNGDNDSLLGPS
tara:strand:+ start:8655 stop:9233 length:579 start_codon:yes stop_codon:yes gene_type:complete